VSALVDLLISAKSDTELREAERAVASASRKAVSESTAAVLASLSSVKDVKTRCSLLGVLGRIGGSKSLSVLREALEDDNSEVQTAAIRGLSNWPTAEPVDDLLKIAESSDNQRYKALAFRGFVRMIGLESDRSQKETVKMYQKAMALASNASEKKMVLSGLARTESFAALEMAAAYLEDEALQQEAAAAIVRIAYAIGESHPEQTRMLLQKVIEISKSDSLRELREWAQEMIGEIE